MKSTSNSESTIGQNERKTTGAFARAAFVSALICFFTVLIICVLVFADDQTVGIYEWLSVAGSFAGVIGLLSGLITVIVALVALLDYIWKFRIRKFGRIAGSILIIFTAALIMPALGKLRPATIRHACETQMERLGKDLNEYETAHGALPPKDDWSRQLHFEYHHPIIPGDNTNNFALNERLCGQSLKGVSPDTVLAFECNLPGSSPVGSRSALTADAHNGVGANILFADLNVKFVRKKDFDKLKW